MLNKLIISELFVGKLLNNQLNYDNLFIVNNMHTAHMCFFIYLINTCIEKVYILLYRIL